MKKVLLLTGIIFMSLMIFSPEKIESPVIDCHVSDEECQQAVNGGVN